MKPHFHDEGVKAGEEEGEEEDALTKRFKALFNKDPLSHNNDNGDGNTDKLEGDDFEIDEEEVLLLVQ